MPKFNIPYGFQLLTDRHLDVRFGPYPSIQMAMESTKGVRVAGLKLGVINGDVVDVYTVQKDVNDLRLDGQTGYGKNLYLDSNSKVNVGAYEVQGGFVLSASGDDDTVAKASLINKDIILSGDNIKINDTTGANLIEVGGNSVGINKELKLTKLNTTSSELSNNENIRIGNDSNYISFIDSDNNIHITSAGSNRGGIVYTNGMPVADKITQNMIPTIDYVEKVIAKNVVVDIDNLGLKYSDAITVPAALHGVFIDGGVAVGDGSSVTPDDSIIRRRGGRAVIKDAISDNEAITLRQLRNEISGLSTKYVANENINVPTPETIFKNYQILSAQSSGLVVLPGEGGTLSSYRSLILGSDNAFIKGQRGNGATVLNNSIISSQAVEITAGVGVDAKYLQNNTIIASVNSKIIGARGTCAIIASVYGTMEEYDVPLQYKWNSALIASRESKVKASNSYTLVTGQGTVSNASGQLVIGTYNLDEPSVSIYTAKRKIFVVGNGDADYDPITRRPTTIRRKNAFHINFSGEVWVQSEIEIDKAEGGIIMRDTVTGKRNRITLVDGVLVATEI